MTEAVFRREDDRFLPTEQAGSPWGDSVLHGGPPAGLLAREIQRFAAAPEMQVVRLTIDLFRPVPMAPLALSARTARAGRRIHVVDATLSAGGIDVCRASGLLLHTAETPIPEESMSAPRGPESIESSSLPGGARPRSEGRQGFHTAIEVRWVATVSDFVNAMSGAPWAGGARFINTDSTIYLHRMPAGEWIGLQAERSVTPVGVGWASALLFDTKGLVGRATQALLANNRA